MPLSILFEDNHCLAVLKPAPLLTQAPPSAPSLESLTRDYLRDRYQKQGRIYLGVPHRLDRAVSGVVVFAKQTKSAQRLAQQFQEHRVQKSYLALVEGRVTPDEGIWEDWMRKVPDEPRAEATTSESEGSKLAMLSYHRMWSDDKVSLVLLSPRTGRMHQLRLQTSLRGHPVVGDALYGANQTFGPVSEEPRDHCIALHAWKLTFDHPISFERMTITAPLPEMWNEVAIPDVSELLKDQPGEQ